MLNVSSERVEENWFPSSSRGKCLQWYEKAIFHRYFQL